MRLLHFCLKNFYSYIPISVSAWWAENDCCCLCTVDLSNVNTLRPRQNGRHFAGDIFKCIFMNENVWIPIEISLKFVPKDPINNILALVRIMVWRRPGDKPLSEPMMVSLLMHICVTQPQWVNNKQVYQTLEFTKNIIGVIDTSEVPFRDMVWL